MAFDSTKYFTALGRVIYSTNTLYGIRSTIDSVSDAIEAVMEAQGVTYMWQGKEAVFQGMKNDLVSSVASVRAVANTITKDKELVGDEINVRNQTVASLVAGIIEWMNDNSETVDDSTVSFGTGVSETVNSGAGTLKVGTLLDGSSTLGLSRYVSNKEYNNTTSELGVDGDTIFVRCTSASADGSESWAVYSQGASVDPYQVEDERIGDGGTLQTATNLSSGFSNGNFETFSVTDTPDDWTMSGGVATTDFAEENTLYFRDTSSLFVKTSGVAFRQQVSGLQKNKLYMLSVQVARNSGDPTSSADVVLTVENSAASVTYATSTTTVNKSDANGTYIPLVLYFQIDPGEDETDVYIKITTNNFVSSPTGVYYDEVLVHAPSFYGGLPISVLRGPERFEVGDYMGLPVNNSHTGSKFQEFFGKHFGAQLPSSGSPTHANSLCT